MKSNKANENIIYDNEYGYVFQTQQTIGNDFWNNVKQAQDDFDLRKEGYQKVAAIPTALVNKWYREGFDIFSEEATINEINARLKKEEMDRMIITPNVKF